MKKLIFIIWILIISNTSCEKSHNDKIPDGVYIGTFQRQLAFGGGDIAQITISFSSNTYSGVSDKPRYPAFCDGTYNIEKQKIIFVNACVWTADFDWSLILSGEYNFTLIGKLLVITRSFLGSSTDTWIDKYTLTKQE